MMFSVGDRVLRTKKHNGKIWEATVCGYTSDGNVIIDDISDPTVQQVKVLGWIEENFTLVSTAKDETEGMFV